MRRRGFTFIELLVAMMILSVAMLALLWMTSYSRRGSMDAYYQFLAFNLAKEPIEVFRAFGYDWLENYNSHVLAKYPAEFTSNPTPQAIVDQSSDLDQHPFEAGLFQRSISLEKTTVAGINAVKITVSVSPAGYNRVDVWLQKNLIKLSSVIVEGPK